MNFGTSCVLLISEIKLYNITYINVQKIRTRWFFNVTFHCLETLLYNFNRRHIIGSQRCANLGQVIKTIRTRNQNYTNVLYWKYHIYLNCKKNRNFHLQIHNRKKYVSNRLYGELWLRRMIYNVLPCWERGS